MRQYKAINKRDIGKNYIMWKNKTWESPIGFILPQDVGKRIYLVNDILQCENETQRTKREMVTVLNWVQQGENHGRGIPCVKEMIVEFSKGYDYKAEQIYNKEKDKINNENIIRIIENIFCWIHS